MPAVDIKYARPTEWRHHGRNGFMQAHGIAVETASGDEIFLLGITSTGHASGAARLVVPKESIPDLIEALKAQL